MRDTKQKHTIPNLDPLALEVSKEQFKELANKVVQFVETTGLGTESFMPHLMIFARRVANNDGQLSDIETIVVGINDGFNDADAKHSILRQIGQKVYEEKFLPAAVFMVSEAWSSSAFDPVTKERLYEMPSLDPNRKEILTIVGVSISREDKIGISIPVKRDANDMMQRDGENDSTDKVEPYLLEHFWRGYFEKLAAKMGKKI